MYTGILEVEGVGENGEQVYTSVAIHLPTDNVHRKKADGSWETLTEALANTNTNNGGSGGSNIAVDPTLNITGQAADSKVTGDELRKIKNTLLSGITSTPSTSISSSSGNTQLVTAKAVYNALDSKADAKDVLSEDDVNGLIDAKLSSLNALADEILEVL